MASFNKVILLGNLTRDPEVRYTPKGSAVTDLGIAVNRQYTLENGEKREEVTFVDVTFWWRTAEEAGGILIIGESIFFLDGLPGIELFRNKFGDYRRAM